MMLSLTRICLCIKFDIKNTALIYRAMKKHNDFQLLGWVLLFFFKKQFSWFCVFKNEILGCKRVCNLLKTNWYKKLNAKT